MSFCWFLIEKSNNPRELTYSNNTLPSQVSNQIKTSSIISLLYYDGKKVRYDWKSSDIGEETRLYGFVMSRSILSYLLGKSFCEGRIKSLNDTIGTYVKELKGTFYGNVKITDALNMTAGDQEFAKVKETKAIMLGEKSVFELINEFSDRSPSKIKFFNDSVRSALAFGWVVASTSPEGFGKFASKALSQEAGFNYPSFFLADKSNIPKDVGFYATRTDWLRAAIRIGELYNSRGCMGDYLKSATRNSVRTKEYSNRAFGKYFWLKNGKLRFNSLEMKSNAGGQRAVIDVDKGRVLIIQAINKDYNEKIIYDAIFN